MSFNKSKSSIIFHTHYKKWNRQESFEDIQIVKKSKVLGYILDQKLDNKEQMINIKKKVEKAWKMIRISAHQNMNQWMRGYLFQTYAMPHISYASAQFFIANKYMKTMKRKSGYK